MPSAVPTIRVVYPGEIAAVTGMTQFISLSELAAPISCCENAARSTTRCTSKDDGAIHRTRPSECTATMCDLVTKMPRITRRASSSSGIWASAPPPDVG